MPSIRNQALSLRARTNLGKSESAQGVAMERLSSGLRINHAADDAAGESIAGHFTAQLRGQHQAARNANDGISLAQTIEGALGEMGRSLQRIRELAVQSQNGTLSLDDLQAIQAEIDQHLAEIERISHQTRFNNLDVLAQDVDIPLQIGVNDGDTIDINTRRVDTKTLELDRIDVVHDPRLGGAVDRTVIDTEPDPAPTAPPPAVAPPPAIAPPTTTTATLNMRSGSTTLTMFQAFMIRYDFNGATYYNAQVHDFPTAGVMVNYRVTPLPTATGGVLDIDVTTLPVLDVTTLSAAEVAAIAVGTVSLPGGTITVPATPPVTPPVAPPVAPTPPAPAPAAPLPADGVKKDTPIRLFDFLQSLAPVPTARDGRPLFDQDSKVHYLTDASGNANGEYVVSGSDGNFYDISISSTGEVSFKPKDAPPTVNLKVAPMKRVNNALGQVDSLRGELGAMQNRLGSVITNLNHTAGILSQARSRIEDADYAVETSNLTRQQILQQASKVALTQANQLAQNVLALLKED
ncbi:flagellin [Achromobacter xylosoxidans]|uniref:flagellin N-terminal helical domain-containing protein n=11 Tax=Alcaligenes xylosoxydans xylosoxydans TaxID=85698 RepID=UPI0006BF2A82|nr:flagellin [Achromobacter xylosoxidans]QQE59079.1 flagellin [Achromobacter xylosoxidans]QQV12823.1 flagellin [Achromobacter xylosoxidans]UXL02915.1 flagellin [Achromobacter xylosoxidans]CUI87260.1 Phase 1-I flagellin [Achromobacter xylosoxidans]CUJ00756.1 Phase 1-I flagellin [Achromobacter xylosoxidans]